MASIVLFKMKRQGYAWVMIAPAAWLVVTTVTAGLEKVFSASPAVGFISHARMLSQALGAGKVLAPANSLEAMSRVIFNDYLDATLAALFVAVVVAMVIYGYINIRAALGTLKATAHEIEFAGAAMGGKSA
jgi:carbon starvation protein CstA